MALTTINGKGLTTPVELYHSDSKKLETTSGGVQITGRLNIGTSTEGHAAADELTLENTAADMGMTLRSGTGNQGAIYFSDGTSGDAEYRGIVLYNHANDAFSIYTSATERLRVDSTGRISTGKAGVGSYNDASEWFKVQSNDTAANISIVASNDTHSSLNLGDEDDFNIQKIKSDHTNNSLQFFTNNTECMRIGSNGEVGIGIDNPEAYGANGTGYLGLVVQAPTGNYSGITIRSNYAGGGLLAFADGSGSGAERKNLALQADHPNKRLNIMVDNAGVARFSANGFHPNPNDSAAANALDDYEEGTFDVNYKTGNAGGNTVSAAVYSSTGGLYTKIGDMVHFQIRIKCSSHTAVGGQIVIEGLPFTQSESTKVSGAYTTLGAALGSTPAYLHIDGTEIRFQTQANANFGSGAGGVNLNEQFHCAGTYKI